MDERKENLTYFEELKFVLHLGESEQEQEPDWAAHHLERALCCFQSQCFVGLLTNYQIQTTQPMIFFLSLLKSHKEMWWVLQWQRQLSTFTWLVNLLHILAQKSDISLKLKPLFIRNTKVGGKKMEEKTSQPLLCPKDPPRLPSFGFFLSDVKQKRRKKRGKLFPIEVYSQMKTCTTINTADREMTQLAL